MDDGIGVTVGREMASNWCGHGTPIRTGCDARSDAGMDHFDAFTYRGERVGKSAIWFCGRGGRFYFPLRPVHRPDLLPCRGARRISRDDAEVVGTHAAAVWIPRPLAGVCVYGRGAHRLPWRSTGAAQPVGFLLYRRSQASNHGSRTADLSATIARYPADVHHFSTD